MKLKEMYHAIICEGMKADLRAKSAIDKALLKKKKEFRPLSLFEKGLFDKDNQFNPYVDTQLFFGDLNKEIKRVLVRIDTIVGMRLSDTHCQKVKQEHINVIIAGYMASDNLGMNLLLDKLEKKGGLEIVAYSGFRRFIR